MWESFLQNDYLMMAVGLLPAAAVVIPLLLAKKLYAKTAYMVLTLGLAASLALTSTVGAITLTEAARAQSDDKETNEVYTPVSDEYLSVFSGFMLEGGYDEAESIINDYSKIYGYDSTAALMSAELAFMRQDYSGALNIWRKLYGDTLPEEAAAAEKIVRYKNSLISGSTLALSANEISEAKLLIDGGAAEILDKKLMNRKDVDTYREAAKLVGEADLLFAEGNREAITEALEKLDKAFNKIDNDEVLNAMSPWRVGKLKINLMNGDYDDILDGIDAHATAEEYSAMLDLYIDGQISDKELIKAFDLEAPEGSNDVRSQLKKIKSNSAIELTAEQESSLEGMIDRLSDYDGNEARYFFEERLTEFIEDPYCKADRSKLYFQLATLSAINGDASSQNEYFSKALTYSAESGDIVFASAMCELANTIVGMAQYNTSGRSSEELAEIAGSNRYLIPNSARYVASSGNDSVVTTELQAYTVKTGSAINIQTVDVSVFPKVTLTALISDEFLDEGELSRLMELRDCNRVIDGLEISKASYDTANYILVGDNSGSMTYSDIGLLQEAIHAFLDASDDGDSYGFYTFDDSIMTEIPLGSATVDEIRTAVDNMYPAGGTSIYDTLKTLLNDTPASFGSSNVIILMTDGHDGDYYGTSITTVSDEIIELANSKGYMIYLVAVGDNPDEQSLSYIAESTGGSAIVSPTSEQLKSLYTFIRSQAENKYSITFTAKDTTSEIRPLELTFEGKEVSDLRYYSITGESVTYEDGELIEGYTGGKEVYGLETKLVYKYGNAVEVNVKGSGFTEADVMYVTLVGDRAYKLRAAYTNGTTFKIILPESIATGVYDAEISLNNGRGSFDNELTVTDGSTVAVTFGDYTFEAMRTVSTVDGVTLIGDVTMNGWLHFKGDVTLTGDLENGSEIYLTDASGSTVTYNDPSAVTGYTYYLAQNGIAQQIPALGTTILVKEVSPDNYHMTRAASGVVLDGFMELKAPSIAVFPEYLLVEYYGVSAKLAMKDLLMSGVNSSFTPFSFDLEGSGTIGKDAVVFAASREFTNSSYSSYTFKLLDTTASARYNPSAVVFDTSDASAAISYKVKLQDFVVDSFIDFNMEWRGMALDTVELELTEPHTRKLGSLSVTVEPFILGFEDMAETSRNASAAEMLALELSGDITVTSASAKDLVPKLTYYIGEASALDLGTGTYSFTLGSLDITGISDVTFLGGAVIEDAKVSLSGGEVVIEAENGLEYSHNGLDVKLTDSAEISICDVEMAIDDYSGEAEITAGWWGHTAPLKGSAEHLTFGLLYVYSGSDQLELSGSINDNGTVDGFGFYITDNGTVSGYIGD